MEQDNSQQNNPEQSNVVQSEQLTTQPKQNSSKRKPLILFLGILFLILVSIIFAVAFVHNSEHIPASHSQTQVLPTVTPALSYAHWSRINLDTFSIEAPLGSDNTINAFYGGGGYMVTIVPPKSSTYPNQPIFDVEAYNSPQDLQEKQILYLAEGAKKDTLSANNMKLPELLGSYKKRMINSQPVYTPTQLRLAYLVKPDSFYVFRMYYSSSVPVAADENLYKQFIASFLLNK
jgi:hypothetical protein